MHGMDDTQLSDLVIRYFTGRHCFWNNADDFPASFQNRVREHSHQTLSATAVNETNAPFQEGLTHHPSSLRIYGSSAAGRTAEYTDSFHRRSAAAAISLIICASVMLLQQ